MRRFSILFFLCVYLTVLSVFVYKAAQIAHEISTIRWDGSTEWEQQ